MCFRNPQTGTLANSADPDKMPDTAAFHQGLHCLHRIKLSLEKEIQFYLEIITCDPSIYTTNHPKVIASYLVVELIRIQRVKPLPWAAVRSKAVVVYSLFIVAPNAFESF